MLRYLIIDEDAVAAEELRVLLAVGKRMDCLGLFVNVPMAFEPYLVGGVDLLFIRITAWDDYQKVAPLLPKPPRHVVFLSGRMEKCTQFLAVEVDFHLQPPYTGKALATCLGRMTHPFFTPRPLDFFFLRVNCRYRVVPYWSLQTVECKGNYLEVRTDRDKYLVAGSLAQFQRRMPVTFSRVGRGLLVASN
jgi:DNA-binding LytR/AlgR family response regulator